MSNLDIWYCIIYTRISDPGQTGFGSQEHRCREHAAMNNWPISAVFYDEITGGGDFRKRRGMVDLINYLEANPDKKFII